MPRLSVSFGGSLYVKRDDCQRLGMGGNKIRQLEFYFGDALAKGADTVLITGAVQSNFVRSTAAAAAKLGMDCHVQLEERVADPDSDYRRSGNVLLDQLYGATIHHFPEGEDEAGADARVHEIADELKQKGHKPYVIPLSPGHPPRASLGYVVVAQELLQQFKEQELDVGEIVVASGSGSTHGGLLFGLRALGSDIRVTGVCVRRETELQTPRIAARCEEIADLLECENPVPTDDVITQDDWLAPGYGKAGEGVLSAIMTAARMEALICDPTYTGKVFAGFLSAAVQRKDGRAKVFIHTGGTPGIFGYVDVLSAAAG